MMRTKYGSLFFVTVLVISVAPSHAAVVVTAVELNDNVLFTVEAGGSLNLTGLSFAASPNEASGGIAPSLGGFALGGALSRPIDAYTGFTGPSSLGSGELRIASFGQGDRFGISGGSMSVMVPDGYTSGDTLSGDSTYSVQTFETLGLEPGIYQWTWPSDSITLNVISSVPLPAAYWLMASALVIVGSMRRGNSGTNVLDDSDRWRPGELLQPGPFTGTRSAYGRSVS